MPQKLHRRKRILRHSRHQKGNFPSYLTIYIPLFFISIVSFAIARSVLASSASTLPCANTKSCTTDLSLKIENNVPGMFAGKRILPPVINPLSQPSVLGIATASGEKHIYVDLSTQTLTAYQGTTLILKTLVSTGKWNPTPTGNFHIWEKLLATRMSGGEGADAYDLPNVPYVMYFYNDYGLHGAYWHDNFGHPMSHGCVNMRQIDAKTLYEWADGPDGNKPGTEVSICDTITPEGQCIQNNPVQ